MPILKTLRGVGVVLVIHILESRQPFAEFLESSRIVLQG